MDHNAIIARAFEITRRHKVLWIFGFLAAIAGGGGGSANFRSSSSGSESGIGSAGDLITRIESMDFPGQEFVRQLLMELDALGSPAWLDLERLLDPGSGEIGGLLGVLLLFCGAIIVLIVALVVIRLVSEAALIRMVDAIEEGEGVSFGYGLELALTWRSARWFLLEILAGLLSMMIVIPLIVITVVPIGLLISQGDAGTALGVVLAIGLVLLGIPLMILYIVAYGLTQRFWSREILIGGADMGAAVASALGMLRANLVSILLLWFILLVIKLIYFAVSVFLFFVALVIAAAVGIAFGASVFSLGASAIVAAIIGFGLAMVFLLVPMIFISGLYIVFDSSAWTLAWRWMDGAGLGAPDLEPAPAYDPDFGGVPEDWREPAPESPEPMEPTEPAEPTTPDRYAPPGDSSDTAPEDGPTTLSLRWLPAAG